jgi:predicted nucleic acid-binding protein
MRFVVNATPLIALAFLDRLELLQQMFDEILFPDTAYDKVVVKGAGRPAADAVDRADWLQLYKTVNNVPQDIHVELPKG